MKTNGRRSLLGPDAPDEQTSLTHLSELRDRLRTELGILDRLIGDLEVGAANSGRELGRFELGEVLGATGLARLLGISRNAAHKCMTTGLAALTWTDRHGWLRIRRSDVEARLADGAA